MNLSELDQPPQNIATDLILEQMERLLTSRHFRQTRMLDKFLRHTITKTLAGEQSVLKESLIGREVFHRGEDFNPALDAVVRVQAGILRKKLSGYYANEGLADEIIIELPKGCYVPVFALRAQAALIQALPEPSLTESQALAVVPGIELDSARQAPGNIRWNGGWRVAAAFLLGLATMLGWQQWKLGAIGRDKLTTGAKPLQPDLLPLWGKFFAQDAPTMLAFGTPQFFAAEGLYLRDVNVNSPTEISSRLSRLTTLQKTLKPQLQPVAETYTGIGEAHGIHTLAAFFWEHAQPLDVSRNRLVGWEKVKNHNIIFLSSMRFQTLAHQLGYPSDFVINKGSKQHIINLRPQLGEQAEYQGGTYAVITLWPGKAANRYVLQLSGNDTWGTLAAAEYVTNEESMRQLNGHLEACRSRHGWPQHPPYFQVLVHAEVKDSQPITASYLTHHDLELNVTNNQMAAVAR
jgi:hypothetical protein